MSTAYAVITARYHALANALNSGVPALSCSWSHKYEMLYKDYGLSGYIIDMNNNKDEIIRQISMFIEPDNIELIKKQLKSSVLEVRKLTQEMWSKVWSI